MNRYLDLKLKWDRVRSLDYELYAVNSSAHPEEWVPWQKSGCVKNNRTYRDRKCRHESLKRSTNQHGSYWKCTCDKQLCYIAFGRDRPPIWFAGVVQIPVNYQQNADKSAETMITMDSGRRRSVAGRDWHSNMIRWTQSYGPQPQTKSTKESFEFGGGEVVHSTRSPIYPIMLNGHLVELDVTEVGRCPLLLSSQSMRSLGMELNYATSKVNIHSCQLKLDLEEDKGGQPNFKFPKPTQQDLNNVPKKYRKATELQQAHITAQRKVQFETETNDINKTDHDDYQPFVHKADMAAIKKGTRKKLFGNVKDALEAYEEGAKERPLPQPIWHGRRDHQEVPTPKHHGDLHLDDDGSHDCCVCRKDETRSSQSRVSQATSSRPTRASPWPR